MLLYATAAQLVISFSIVVVWIFRFDNIVREFREFGLPDIVRNLVGGAKISLATLLVVGIWHPELATVPALIMAFLMLCAQGAHFRIKNPWYKYLPSMGLMLMSLFVAAVHLGILKL